MTKMDGNPKTIIVAAKIQPEEIRKLVDKELLAKQKYALTKDSVLTGIPADLTKGIKLTG